MKKLPIHGFSLFELLVVIALIGLASLPLAFYARQTNQSQALKTSVSVLTDDLQEAKNSARDARNQSAWGIVSTGDHSYVLTYGSNTQNMIIKTVSLEDGVTFVNPFSVWFTVGTGYLSGDKSIRIQNDQEHSYEITINEAGVIDVKQP